MLSFFENAMAVYSDLLVCLQSQCGFELTALSQECSPSPSKNHQKKVLFMRNDNHLFLFFNGRICLIWPFVV